MAAKNAIFCMAARRQQRTQRGGRGLATIRACHCCMPPSRVFCAAALDRVAASYHRGLKTARGYVRAYAHINTSMERELSRFLRTLACLARCAAPPAHRRTSARCLYATLRMWRRHICTARQAILYAPKQAPLSPHCTPRGATPRLRARRLHLRAFLSRLPFQPPVHAHLRTALRLRDGRGAVTRTCVE